jgi:hypothetical protein
VANNSLEREKKNRVETVFIQITGVKLEALNSGAEARALQKSGRSQSLLTMASLIKRPRHHARKPLCLYTAGVACGVDRKIHPAFQKEATDGVNGGIILPAQCVVSTFPLFFQSPSSRESDRERRQLAFQRVSWAVYMVVEKTCHPFDVEAKSSALDRT